MEEQKQGMPAEAPKPSGGEKNTGMAIVAYILFFIPLLTGAHKEPFVKYHVKQGLVIFCVGVIIWLLNMMIPWYWWWQFSFLFWILRLLQLGLLVLAILGIMNASQGKEEPVPVVGQFAKLFKF
jgi:uncharacterized membrane protein